MKILMYFFHLQPSLGLSDDISEINPAQWPKMVQFINNGHYCWFNSSSVALMWIIRTLNLKLPHESTDQPELGIFWNWICYWLNLNRRSTQV